jgi:hypothetical protein
VACDVEIVAGGAIGAGFSGVGFARRFEFPRFAQGEGRTVENRVAVDWWVLRRLRLLRMTILSNLSDWRNNAFFGLESNRLFNAQGFGGVADVSGGTCQMSAR